MIHQELATEKRIVLDTPNFVSFARMPALSIRDVDFAQAPRQPLRKHPEKGGRRAGHAPENDPDEAGTAG